MAYSIDFLPGAEIDLDDIVDWYARFNIQLADDFLKRIDLAIASILSHPKQFQKVYKSYRKINLVRFPYKIIYRIERHAIVIVAIAHHKRNEAYWKRRK